MSEERLTEEELRAEVQRLRAGLAEEVLARGQTFKWLQEAERENERLRAEVRALREQIDLQQYRDAKRSSVGELVFDWHCSVCRRSETGTRRLAGTPCGLVGSDGTACPGKFR